MARKSYPRGRKSRTRLIVVLVTSLVIVGSFAYLYADYYTPKLKIDWRVKLAIFDSRINQNLTIIPAGIGVQGGIWVNHTFDAYGWKGYAPLSTRGPPASDGTATIFVQSTTFEIFFLGDFFDIWGKQLSQSCVIDYCAGPDNPPPFVSSGDVEDCVGRDLLLSEGITWMIVLGSNLLADQCG